MKVRLFVVLTLVVSFAAVVGPSSTPSAEACPLPVRTPFGVKLANCSGGSGSGSGGGGGGGGGGPICWLVGEPSEGIEELIREEDHPDAPDEVTWWQNICGPRDAGNPSDQAFWYPAYTTWSVPVPLAPGDPVEILLLEDLWVEVEQRFEDPELELWPPVDNPAIVNIPTFVSLENPPTAFGVGPECADFLVGVAPICVEMQGEPTLWFDPGDGSERVECAPDAPGFDPEDARDPDEQAGGACTHVYRQHTGEEAYPGQVQIEWTVTWSSTNADGTVIDGVFDPIFLPDGEPNAPRVVQEVQTLVNEIEFGEPEG